MNETHSSITVSLKNPINPHLKNIDYKKRAVSRVINELGYDVIRDDNTDYEYSDFKAYLNLELERID